MIYGVLRGKRIIVSMKHMRNYEIVHQQYVKRYSPIYNKDRK
jgi:hypothetical protein